MGWYKNISGGELDVPFAPAGFVQADEIVELPDVQADGESPIVWPPNRWEPAADPNAKPAKPKE